MFLLFFLKKKGGGRRKQFHSPPSPSLMTNPYQYSVLWPFTPKFKRARCKDIVAWNIGFSLNLTCDIGEMT